MSENAPWPQAKSAGFFVQAQVCRSAQDPLPQTTEDDVARIASVMDKVPAQKQKKTADVRLNPVAKERLRMAALCPNGRVATLLDPSATDSATVIQQMLDKGYKVIDRSGRPNVAPPPPRLI